MKKIKELIREARLMLAELFAYRLSSIREALHYHHTPNPTGQHQ